MAEREKRDVLLEHIGCGKYQVAAFLACCVCNVAEAVAICSFTLAVSVAVCDMGIETSFVPFSFGILSLGAAAGGPLLGVLSDAFGRKLVILVSVIIAACGLLIATLAISKALILFAAVLLGFGWGAVGPAVRVYLAEIATPGMRRTTLTLLDFIWVLTYLISLLVWRKMGPLGGIHPNSPEVNILPMAVWRKGLLVGCLVCMLSACVASGLRNTPRHLLCKGRTQEAHDLLRRMYAVNNEYLGSSYQPPAELSEVVRLRPLPAEDQSWYVPARLQSVLSDRTAGCDTLAIAVATASSSPGWVPLLVWASRLLASVEGPAWWLSAGCSDDLADAEKGFYQHLLTGVIVTLLVLPYVAIPADSNRLSIACFLGFASAISLAMLAENKLGWLDVLLGVMICMLAGFVAAAEALLRLVSVEMYPTHSRATMAGLVLVPRRLLTAILLMLPETSCSNLCYVHGGALLVGAVAALFLPELKGKPLVE